jgi:molecular chaperone DnaJ
VAAAQFQQISEAYETLSDPDRRRRYDTTGLSPEHVEHATFGFEGFDFSITSSGPGASTFGDLFGDALRHREPKAGAGVYERGADLHHTLTIGFEEAMRGGHREIALTRQEHCRRCRGTGFLASAEIKCERCQGTGAVRSARGHMVFSKPCPACDGTGRRSRSRCPACDGRQLLIRTEPLTVDLPAGLADGARIRVPERGHAGAGGGQPGDLYITVRVDSHPLFRRDGDDFHIVLPVAIHEAALGAKVEVPTLEGTARLRVPPGTQSGQLFRLRERGAPSVRDGKRGDLIVEVRLVLPGLMDERSKELLREFGRINHEDVRHDLIKK